MIRAYFDGASRSGNPGNGAWAYAIYDKRDIDHIIFQSATIPGKVTNNYAEYTALIMLLKRLSSLQLNNAAIFGDSELVVKQVCGEYACRSTTLKELCAEATALFVRGGHALIHVKGHDGNEGNEFCDKLCNAALDKEGK